MVRYLMARWVRLASPSTAAIGRSTQAGEGAGPVRSRRASARLAVLVLAASLAPTLAMAIVPTMANVAHMSLVTIDNKPGQQLDPHISGTLVAYTDNTVIPQIGYFDFKTGVGTAISNAFSDDPFDVSLDLWPDVSGSTIVFTRQHAVTSRIMEFDVVKSALTEVDPAASPFRFGSAVGGNTVAYVDHPGVSSWPSSSLLDTQVVAWSRSLRQRWILGTYSGVQLGTTPVSVSSDGNVIGWRIDAGGMCTHYQAILANGSWAVSAIASTAYTSPYVGRRCGGPSVDTSGKFVAYVSNGAVDLDIFIRSVSTGKVTQVEIPGEQLNPRVAGNFIAFQSIAPGATTADVYVYDVAANLLYPITATTGVNETLNDITLAPGEGRVRMDWSPNDQDIVGANIAFNDDPPQLVLRKPLVLSPPDGTYRTITIRDLVQSATDYEDGDLMNRVRIERVTSDEAAPVTLDVSLRSSPDIAIAGLCESVQLRASANRALNGRVYTVTLRVSDSANHTVRGQVQVTVPVDPSKPAVADPPLLAATGACA